MKIASKGLWADVSLIAVTIIWASTFTVIKGSLPLISPGLLIALRFWIAVFVMALLIPRAWRRIPPHTLRCGGWLAVALSAGFLCQTMGLQWTTPSRCAFITSMYVLLVPLLGWLVLRQPLRGRTLFGVGMAALGLGLLTLRTADFHIGIGDLLSLAGAAAFAGQILMLGRFLTGNDFRQLAVVQIAGTALICSLIVPVIERPFWTADFRLVGSLALLGIFATALAFFMQSSAQRHTSPNRAVLLFSLEPFFATLIAYWALGDRLTGREWLGGCLVLAGILSSEIRRRRCRQESAKSQSKESLPGTAVEFE